MPDLRPTSASRRTAVRIATAAAVLALAGGTLGPAAPARAVEDGVGIIKIANTANGTWASIDSQGYTAPGSGLQASAGNVLKVKTWELKSNARYALWIIWPAALAFGIDCRFADADTGRIMPNALLPGTNLTKMRTDAFGRLDRDPGAPGPQAYKALVPDDPMLVQGRAQICGREVYPVPNHSATQHVHLTIL